LFMRDGHQGNDAGVGAELGSGKCKGHRVSPTGIPVAIYRARRKLSGSALFNRGIQDGLSLTC
jgi:hypothetical protein